MYWTLSRDGSNHAEALAQQQGTPDKVKTYLVNCMARDAGFGGLVNAFEVLKWKRSVLLERWEENEKEVGTLAGNGGLPGGDARKR